MLTRLLTKQHLKLEENVSAFINIKTLDLKSSGCLIVLKAFFMNIFLAIGLQDSQ